ncbi:MAG: EI24 domain-containing protein [Putridiphycobacter sp.]
MIQGFFNELSNSISFVFKKHLYLYFLPAIFISLIFYLSVKGGDGIVGWLSFMEDWWVIGWIIKSLESIISAVSFVLFEFFILVLLTPINSYFAEKVQEDITGIEAKFDMQQFVRSIGRSLKIFLVAFSTEMLLLLVVWIFSFWAGSWFSTVVGFTVSSFFIGFSFYDFALDLDLQKSKASWQWGKANFWLVLITGLVFSVAIYIPERTGLTFLYIIAISIIPHLLTIASASTYFKSVKSKN